jgi:hypothetical protein
MYQCKNKKFLISNAILQNAELHRVRNPMENWCIGVWGYLQEYPHEKKPKNI